MPLLQKSLAALFLASLLAGPTLADNEPSPKVDFAAIHNPIILQGNDTTAYRDPAAIYADGWFRLFFTEVKTEPDGKVYCYTAWSKSRDLVHWSEPKIFTPRDQNLNFSSPGDIIRFDGQWVLCLQTYPRPNGERFGNDSSRLWIMRSQDLENWGPPEQLRVKGPNVPEEKLKRMIDPYLFEDRDDSGKWWCFYKGGAAWSRDLKTWTPTKPQVVGENPCVILDGPDYVVFRSQNRPDGVGVMRSKDLVQWTDEGELTLGQKDWPWAQGRLTAGFVLDLRKDPAIGKALLFFHGEAKKDGFDRHDNLGLAWSDDLKTWHWPGPGGTTGETLRNSVTSSANPVSGWPDAVQSITYASPADSTQQRAMFYAPPTTKPVPLLVALHTWSNGYNQPEPFYATWSQDNDWAMIHPDFRGPNIRPEACGSDLAVADILGAVDYAKTHANIDPKHIYLVGVSGGGFAAMLMAGRAPQIWAGVSAWCGISDLRAWHEQNAGNGYANMLEKVCGGPPGATAAVDEEYRKRSPLTYLQAAVAVPLDLNTGIHDGHTGSVPDSQSLRAFNLLAAPADRISEADMATITRNQQLPPGTPPPFADAGDDREQVLLRRVSGNVRITVFEGGHTIFPAAALAWLAEQRRGKPAVWDVPKSLNSSLGPTASGK